MNLPTWALVELGLCPNCAKDAWLFTHSCATSLYGYTEADGWRRRKISMCIGCHKDWLDSTVYRDSLSEESLVPVKHLLANLPKLVDYEITADAPNCHVCYGVMRPDNIISASYANDCTIIVQVHRSCSNRARCCSRDIINDSYHWHTEGNPDLSSENFYRQVTINHTTRCQSCTDLWLEEEGFNFEDDFFYCNSCGSNFHNDHLSRYRGEDYCQNCVDNNVYTCDDCSEEYWDGDDHDCRYPPDTGGVIMEYHEKPEPIFFGMKSGKERIFFGFELEVELIRGDRFECAEKVQNAFGKHVYIKHDGSLSHGFEIVTHPHTLESFHTEFAWENLTEFRKMGLRSWDTTTCGLHVHVSRSAFGDDEPYDNRTPNRTANWDKYWDKRNIHQIRFMKLIYDNQRQITRLAGRHSLQYANFLDKGNVVRKMKGMRDEGGRASAVNTYNDSTLEVRVFKGSLKPERVLSAIELVHAAVEYTRDLKVSGKNKALSWLAFAGFVHKNIDTYPNLFAYMDLTLNNDNPAESDGEND